MSGFPIRVSHGMILILSVPFTFCEYNSHVSNTFHSLRIWFTVCQYHSQFANIIHIYPICVKSNTVNIYLYI